MVTAEVSKSELAQESLREAFFLKRKRVPDF